MWPEVKQAQEEKRYELVLTGEEINKKIENEGQLDPAVYELEHLNFLRVSMTPLVTLSEDISNLTNVTNLTLQGNKLQSLPESIGKLEKLKLLDVSLNVIEYLPSGIGNLSCLTSLNASGNKLTSLPSFDNCVNLAILDVRENSLEEFPDICHEKLGHLSEVRLGTNCLSDVPPSLSLLPALKLLDLANNEVKKIPGELIDCPRFKELDLKGNPLSDKRLKKLVESDRCIPRQVLDYIKQHCPRTSIEAGKTGSKGKKGKGGKGKNKDRDEVDDLCDEIQVLNLKEASPVVNVYASVKDVRAYIVCCVLKNLDLTGDNMRKFISAQTKLHEGVCEKRMAATIATHDMAKIQSPIKYHAQPPGDIRIHPLVRGKVVTAKQLYQGLQQEAQNQRKQQKRNVVTGIHKYLHIVEKWKVWPCLEDATGTVISLPPITNSENTKITSATTDVFVEVTSSVSLPKAKEVMNELVILTLGCKLNAKEPQSEDADTTETTTTERALLKVGQVRVEDDTGVLRVIYPSRVDLATHGDTIRVTMPEK